MSSRLADPDLRPAIEAWERGDDTAASEDEARWRVEFDADMLLDRVHAKVLPEMRAAGGLLRVVLMDTVGEGEEEMVTTHIADVPEHLAEKLIAEGRAVPWEAWEPDE